MSRLEETFARRVAEAAATMPSFAVAQVWDPVSPAELLRRLGSALKEGSAVWRDGARVIAETQTAVALPGPVFPVLGEYEALVAREPESFTAAEIAGATFTVWFSDSGWLAPPLLPRQTGGLGVGRAGLTLVADARAVTPWEASAILAAICD